MDVDLSHWARDIQSQRSQCGGGSCRDGWTCKLLVRSRLILMCLNMNIWTTWIKNEIEWTYKVVHWHFAISDLSNVNENGNGWKSVCLFRTRQCSTQTTRTQFWVHLKKSIRSWPSASPSWHLPPSPFRGLSHFSLAPNDWAQWAMYSWALKWNREVRTAWNK